MTDLIKEDQMASSRGTTTSEPRRAAIDGQWRSPIETVADLVNNLLTLDQNMPAHGAIFVVYQGKRRAKMRPLSLSRENVVGPWIWSEGGEHMPWHLVIWSQADERDPLGNTASPGSAERVGGFAPGNYECRCLTCGATFEGDKRAISCRPCAVEARS